MVQSRTVLKVIDNSGVKAVRCITVLKGPRDMGTTGHMIVCSVREAAGGNAIKRGDVVRAMIVRSRNERNRTDGSWFKPGTAACILLNASGNPVGNRIKEVVSKHLLKNRENLKILSLAKTSI